MQMKEDWLVLVMSNLVAVWVGLVVVVPLTSEKESSFRISTTNSLSFHSFPFIFSTAGTSLILTSIQNDPIQSCTLFRATK
jgi:hypothetical protein